jgi:hypothetical protein
MEDQQAVLLGYRNVKVVSKQVRTGASSCCVQAVAYARVQQACIWVHSAPYPDACLSKCRRTLCAEQLVHVLPAGPADGLYSLPDY